MPFGWVAAATVAGAAISSDASRRASNKAADASNYAVDASKEAAQRQADLAERQYSDYREEIRPRELAELDRSTAASRAAEERAGKQFDFEYGNSQKYSDRYWNTQVPLEDSLVEDAQKFSTDAEYERQAGMATSDVRGNFERMRSAMDRDSQRRGVNPGSGAAMALAQEAATAEALAGAGASTSARFNAQQVGFQRRADVAALGRGLPGFSAGSSQLANGVNNTGLNAGQAGLGAVSAASGINNAAASTGSNLWGASVNTAATGANAFNQSLNTAYRSPSNTFAGSIAGGMSQYGFNRLGGG